MKLDKHHDKKQVTNFVTFIYVNKRFEQKGTRLT